MAIKRKRRPGILRDGETARWLIVSTLISLCASTTVFAAPPEPGTPAQSAKPAASLAAPDAPVPAPGASVSAVTAPVVPALVPVGEPSPAAIATPPASVSPVTTPAPAAVPSPPADLWTGRSAAPLATIRAAPVEVTTSYGWQIVVADLGGLVGVAIAGSAHAPPQVSIAPYLLASSIVHVAHGNPGRGVGAMGLRVAMPVVGAVVGMMIGGMGCHGDTCDAAPLALGVLGGMVGATVIDAVWMAHSTLEVAAPQVALAPTFSVARSGGATVGVAATF